MLEFTLVPVCALANRARGSRFFDMLDSTSEGRMLAMCIMVIWVLMFLPATFTSLDAIPVIWGLLMLWCVPGWDNYWAAQIGQSAHSKLWGCVCMFLRQLLILPAFGAVAYFSGGNWAWCAMAGLLWVPYLLWGAVHWQVAIARAEYTVGAMIGFTFAAIIASAPVAPSPIPSPAPVKTTSAHFDA